MGFNNNTTLGNCLEEIGTIEPTVIIEIKKFEWLEQESINTDFWRSLVLDLVLELNLETILRAPYLAMDSDIVGIQLLTI